MLPWKTIISIEKNAPAPVYLQIVNSIIKEISVGHLKSDTKLPGTRSMADLLSLNRKTVIQAYDELCAQGWIELRASQGTFVARNLPIIKYQSLEPNTHESQAELDLSSFEFIKDHVNVDHHEVEIDDGSPDARLAPTDHIFKECRSLTNGYIGKKLLRYADVKGDLKLRMSLAKYLGETRGMKCNHNNILITRGSQMGIWLSVNLLSKQDAVFVVGDTSYDAADWSIIYHKGILRRIPVDQNGMSMDLLEELLKKKKITAVYVTPHHHFPTTVTLSSERRIRLLELSLKHNFAVIEDDYDYDFHYNSSPLLPLASLNHHDHVIYIGSFSKIIAPTMRVGYVVASENFINQISRIRRIIDRQGDYIVERVIANMIENGELSRHLKKALKTYKVRRDYFCHHLRKTFGEAVEFKIPEGGMAVWSRFTMHDFPALSVELLKKGLYIHSSRDFTKSLNAARLGFASLNKTEIDRAFEIVNKTI